MQSLNRDQALVFVEFATPIPNDIATWVLDKWYQFKPVLEKQYQSGSFQLLLVSGVTVGQAMNGADMLDLPPVVSGFVIAAEHKFPIKKTP